MADALGVVRTYYGELEDRRFSLAWRRLSAAQQELNGGFDRWRRGFDTSIASNVVSATARSLDRAGHLVDVSLRLHSIDVDACNDRVSQRFAGVWHLRLTSGRWIARSIVMQKTAGGTVINDPAACPDTAPPDDSSGSGDDIPPEDPAYSAPSEDVDPSYSAPSEDVDPTITPRPYTDTDYTDHDGTYRGAPTTQDFGDGQGSVGLCEDGTYSDSIGRPGACSYHGGVG